MDQNHVPYRLAIPQNKFSQIRARPTKLEKQERSRGYSPMQTNKNIFSVFYQAKIIPPSQKKKSSRHKAQAQWFPLESFIQDNEDNAYNPH